MTQGDDPQPTVQATDPARPSSDAATRVFLRDVLEGLSQPAKWIPGRYLWDDRGGELFDRVTAGPHYYVARQETALLLTHAAEIADLVGEGAAVVEFGSGASHKIRVLLDALHRPRRYVPVDIAGAFLAQSAARIAADYPALAIDAVCGDYTAPLDLPQALHDGPVLGFYPGNTLGTYDEPVLIEVLARMRRSLGRSWFLVGVDPNSDLDSIRRGYADADGLMAAFHRNVLVRLRDELGADVDPDDFRHEALVFADPLRTEAHLIAKRALTVRIGGQAVAFAAGESVRTDTSHKWRPELFAAVARRAGWEPIGNWVDAPELFSLHLLRAS